MPAAPNLTFENLQVPQNLTQDEIAQLQRAISGTRQGTDQLGAVNQLLSALGDLRSVGAHQDVFNKQFANVIDQLAAPGRNEPNMGIAAARAQANRTLSQSLGELNAARDITKKAEVTGLNTDPGAGDLLNKAAAGDPISQQALSERISGQAQLNTQNKQLEGFRNQAETQAFGGTGLSLSDALSSNKGDLQNLNRFLGQQEATTFNTQLKPLIQMALGAQGLSDSGAQVELQSKALAQLEQARQQNIMQAALGARANIQGLQRSDLLGGIGQAQQNLTSQFDLQRAGITMQFQQQLEAQRERLAYQLSQRQGAGGGFGGILQGAVGGGMMGFAAGGPYGAILGAGLGAYAGSQSEPPGQVPYGPTISQTGSFFANSQGNYLGRTFGGRQTSPYQVGIVGGPSKLDLPY